MELDKKLKSIIKFKKTLLGVGPMSLNCVDASIELSNKFNVPIILIASRRQVDSDSLGGGYVNNWTTKTFSNYVKKKDKKQLIILARDHGGPWQNILEKKFNLKKAIKSCKESFKSDIDSDFKIIHIDTSIDEEKKINFKNAFDRLCELYLFCNQYAKKKKKKILFEIGTEEQNGSTNTPSNLDYTLKKFYHFCDSNKLIKPSFVVAQSGTRVMEMRNVGSYESPLRIKNELPVEIQLPKMIEICEKYNIFMKEHNADYLSNESLQWHPKLGIHSANIAPEFGVRESYSLVEILKKFKLKKYLNEFLELSYNSNKWKKWMLPNSKATNFEKSLISGHYIFSTSKFKFLKKKIVYDLEKKRNFSLDKFLKEEVKKSIYRYLKCFRLV